MGHLREALEKFRWNKYDIDAYCALIQHGPCTANDLSIISNIPSGRIHNVLNILLQKGAVRKGLGRPALFDAHNPMTVLDTEIDATSTLCEEAKEEVMPLWETRAESKRLSEIPSIVERISGIVNDIRQLLDDAESSITLVMKEFKWVGREDITRFQMLQNKGINVKVVGIDAAKKVLMSIASTGVVTKITNEIKMECCIKDHSNVLLISKQMSHGTRFVDEDLAELLESELNTSFEGLETVEAETIVV